MEEVYQYVRNKKIVLLTGIVIVVLGGYFFLFHKVTPTSTLEPKQELTTQKMKLKRVKLIRKQKNHR
ncbi:hypothetical protein [Companilactobacillus paralimentarius]|uniref:hypothetical protein n=1 Tax=Companilactobacillus paralimentarius TaxID=83526 RepID=UPI001265FE34|nr:hypothetical protein [Companilactobacillus paralimentarius]QFR70215.1 hypothetical protein LP238_11125 [Companilactobacillus paralimentarius]